MREFAPKRGWRLRPPTAGTPLLMETIRGPVAAADAFRKLFETDCEVYFVFNGTAANSLALASLCQSYHSVICCDQSHVETDECGAPEFFSNGSSCWWPTSVDGKLTPAAIHELATKRQDIHYPKPRAVTVTQPTETGRVYTIEELRAISAICKRHGLSLHMDGARFANACASLALFARRYDLEERRGRAVLWRHEEWNGGWRGGVVFRSALGGRISTIGASRRVNWRRRCGSCRRRGWECSRAEPG